MKKTILTLGLLLALAGCRQEPVGEVIEVDVARSHPEKELVLQDFMDVEYVALETNDDFMVQNNVLAIDDNYIVMWNLDNDRSAYFFDRKTGKALWKMSRHGQGPEEYSNLYGMVLDEENGEIFCNDGSTKRVLVYDYRQGNFKRSLKHAEDASYMIMRNFDKDHLIVWDSSEIGKNGEERGDQCFYMVISKQDGSVTEKIDLPFETIRSTLIEKDGVTMAFVMMTNLTSYQEDVMIAETSVDTVYRYSSKTHELIPMLVNTSGTSEYVIGMETVTSRYIFMEAFKKDFDLKTFRIPSYSLVYDKQEGALYNSVVLNADFTTKQKVNMGTVNQPSLSAYDALNADKLVDAYENNELQGKLKEIAATLDEEDNPVIMLMKMK